MRNSQSWARAKETDGTSMWCDWCCAAESSKPHRGIREGFLEEAIPDIRFERTRGVLQAKAEKRVLGRGDRGIQTE